jgi:hypothetical protein
MAQHDVGLKIPQTLWIEGIDIRIPVWSDGARLGEIHISKGSLDWIPAGKTKRNGHRASWERFAELMENETRRPRVSTRRVAQAEPKPRRRRQRTRRQA